MTSVTGELIENAVIGTPIVEGSKKAGKVVKDEVVDNAENKIERKITQETVENKVVRGESGKGKGDGVGTSGAVSSTEVTSVENLRESSMQNITNNVIENSKKLLTNINYDSKQVGKKWGKHKKDYPEMKDYNEYKSYATELFNHSDKIVYDIEHKEYLYIRGKDLLRIKENGDFVSLYPGANTVRVINAIENGGIIWQQY